MKAIILAAFASTAAIVGITASAQANSISDVVLARIATDQGTATDSQREIVDRYGQ